MFNFKRVIFVLLSFLQVTLSIAQSFYISSSLGSDENDGLSVQSPFKSIDKLNSLVFNAGDSIFLSQMITGRECFG